MRLLLCSLAVLLLAGGASANDTLIWHWPRYGAQAQVTVIPSTDVGMSLDSRTYQWLRLAVDNWNFASKIHLNLAPPGLCAWVQRDGVICVREINDPSDGSGGHTGIIPYQTATSLIRYAMVTINRAYIPVDSDFWNVMIDCHELGEAIGLPDPSDSPVTATAQPTCLTRDYSLLTSIPSAFNYQQLDRLYANIDTAPPPPCKGKGKKC